MFDNIKYLWGSEPEPNMGGWYGGWFHCRPDKETQEGHTSDCKKDICKNKKCRCGSQIHYDYQQEIEDCYPVKWSDCKCDPLKPVECLDLPEWGKQAIKKRSDD